MTAPSVVVGVGAGGNARSVLDAVRRAGGVTIAGMLDNDPSRHGTELDGVPILGGDDLLPALRGRGIDGFFVGVGGGGMLPCSGNARHNVYQAARAAGLGALTVIHPSAVVSGSANVGDGACILAGAIVNAGARIAEGVLVNTGAIVEHDCILGPFSHIATGARLAGGVTVGRLAHVGAGAVVRQGLRIGVGAVIGIGAAVIRDVGDGLVVAGNPARELRKEKGQC